MQYKPQYSDDKLYLETTDEKDVSFPHYESHALFYTKVTEGNTNWLVPKSGFITKFIRSGPRSCVSSYVLDSLSQREKQTISFFLDLPKGVKKFHLKFGIAHARKVEFVIPPIR